MITTGETLITDYAPESDVFPSQWGLVSYGAWCHYESARWSRTGRATRVDHNGGTGRVALVERPSSNRVAAFLRLPLSNPVAH